MQLIQSYTTLNPCYTNHKKITVKGIVLHSTGCAQPKAQVYINSFNQPSIQKSVHAFIQQDGQVFQTLPWDYKGWHVGSGKNGSYNSTHIGIEMCEPSTIKYTGGAQWIDLDPAATTATIANLYKYSVELFAYLCKLYSLNPLQDEVIVSHYEANKRGKGSSHVDPYHLWSKYGITMDQFRADVSKAMGGAIVEPVTPAPSITIPQPTVPTVTPRVDNKKHLAMVEVNPGSSLNIRDKPNGNIIGKLGKGFIVGVDSVESNGWAKINQGGYVSNRYLKEFNNGFAHDIKTFLVQITASALNVRSTPTLANNTNIVGTAKQGQVLTIVATNNNDQWGLLKSGMGYIRLDPKYVQKR